MNDFSKFKRIIVDDIENSYRHLVIRKKNLFSYDLHWHNCFEIELVLKGTFTQNLNGKKSSLCPGDIYLLNPSDFHSIESDGAEVYNIMFAENLFDDDFLQKILSINGNMLFHLDESEFSHAKELIGQMLEEFEKRENYSEIYIKNMLECLLILILRKCDFSLTEEPFERLSDIQKPLLYIHSRFRENPSMAQAAEISGFNQNYFSSLFHNATGKTYKEYLNHLKLEYAKKLILSTDISITEVCFSSGFNSLSNFLRIFKNTYGTSPAKMRKNNF